MAPMRSRVASVLAAGVALGVATEAGLAKSSPPPFKTGAYQGTVTSNISGREPGSRPAEVTIRKVGKGYRLRASLSVRVTCGDKPYRRELSFRGIRVDKPSGLFSGRTSRRQRAWTGTVSGQAKGRQITATWNYAVPDGSCWGNGNLDASHR